MEPPSATDLDRIADTLRRMNTGSSSKSSRRPIPSIELDRGVQITPEIMTAERRYRGSTRGFYPTVSPSRGEVVAQWLQRNEDVSTGYNNSQVLRDSRESMQARPLSRERPRTGHDSMASHRKLSNPPYYAPGYSLYPAPSKPLPPVPTTKPSLRLSSLASSDTSSISTHRSSQASALTSPEPSSGGFSPPPPRKAPLHSYRPPDQAETPYRHPPPRRTATDVVFWKLLQADDKKNGPVHYLDMSSSLSTLASKHGNNIIKIWSTAGGSVQQIIKFSSYTSAQSRSREYLIRSHAILSEPQNLIAIASRFGRCIEIWNWAKKKCLQSIDDADRWTSSQIESYDNPHSSFAVYHGETALIDLYKATQEKKPFVKSRTIDLSKADLPFIPQYPELALSNTSPLLVAAAGPRPPRQGHPPPERETLLVAWETHEDGVDSNRPYRVARPWQHKELDTAIPYDLATYGSAVVSIWIPATFRAVPAVNGKTGYNLTPVAVPYRYVLIWDLAANSTRTLGIPNTTSCVSPDCRFVAYCHSSGTEIGARGRLVILDVMTTKEVWSWPDPEALAIDCAPKQGFEQFEDLSQISELHFSADGKFLNVGDLTGRVGMYEVRESTGDRIQLHMI